MRHSSRGGNEVIPIRYRAGGCRAAAYISSSCAENSSVSSLRSARAELGNGSAICRPDHAICLGGYKGLVVEAKENKRLDKLSLDRGRSDRHDRLTREDRRSLGNGIYITCKPEGGKVIKKSLGEQIFLTEKGYIVRGEFKRFYILYDLLESCGYGKSATVGNLAKENVKISYLVSLPKLKIAVSHSKLVKITKQSVIWLIHINLYFFIFLSLSIYPCRIISAESVSIAFFLFFP